MKPCTLSQVITAYVDCRQHKRSSPAAIAFERDQGRHLVELYEDLRDGRYCPGPSTCFVIMRPKPREVWAAQYRDRIVHHLLYNHIGPRFEAGFIADSCACIASRGTLYAAQRLDAKIRSLTHNWTRPGRYLKCDLSNFFVSIDKPRLFQLLEKQIPEAWWRALTATVLFHDPRPGVERRSSAERLALIPPHKSLFNQPVERGLPIGNLSSQFFANVYLNELDQFVKHRLRARHYIRYVDDFLLLHESPQQLNAWHDAISEFLVDHLALQLNDKKTIRQPIERGTDFVGQLIKPHHRILRRRTLHDALYRLEHMPLEDVHESANSYFGLARQATRSRGDRQRIARAVMRRGHAVNYPLTKTYRNQGSRMCSF